MYSKKRIFWLKVGDCDIELKNNTVAKTAVRSIFYNSQITYKEQFNKMMKLYKLSLGRLIILKINAILNYV